MAGGWRWQDGGGWRCRRWARKEGRPAARLSKSAREGILRLEEDRVSERV